MSFEGKSPESNRRTFLVNNKVVGKHVGETKSEHIDSTPKSEKSLDRRQTNFENITLDGVGYELPIEDESIHDIAKKLVLKSLGIEGNHGSIELSQNGEDLIYFYAKKLAELNKVEDIDQQVTQDVLIEHFDAGDAIKKEDILLAL